MRACARRAGSMRGSRDPEPPVHVIAHPAAIALALFLRRLQAHDPIRRSVIQIFAPASEHGKAGVEELQQQTVSLLSFKSLPQKIFDAQLSFTMLAKYGDEAPVSLEETELRIERHLATLLALEGDGEGAPMPSLRLIQAPVFHGYSFSAWVEFEDNPGVEAIEAAWPSTPSTCCSDEFDPPNNVGKPDRAASPWARSARPQRPEAAGSGWRPITCGWRRKTPSWWRGSSYEGVLLAQVPQIVLYAPQSS